MKKIKVLFALMCSIFALSACKNEEIDSIQDKVDTIEKLQIASISSQVKAIEGTIASLKNVPEDLGNYLPVLNELCMVIEESSETVSGFIHDLENQPPAGDVLARLMAYDVQLGTSCSKISGNIDILASYRGNLKATLSELSSFVSLISAGQNSWAEISLATLKKHDEIIEAIVTLQESLGEIDSLLLDLWEQALEIASLTSMVELISDPSQVDTFRKISSQFTQYADMFKNGVADSCHKRIASAVDNAETSTRAWLNENLNGRYDLEQLKIAISRINGQMNDRETAIRAYLVSVLPSIVKLEEDVMRDGEETRLVFCSQVSLLDDDTAVIVGESILEAFERMMDNAESLLGIVPSAEQDCLDGTVAEQMKTLCNDNVALIEGADKDYAMFAKTVVNDERSLKEAEKLLQCMAKIDKYCSILAEDVAALSRDRQSGSDGDATIEAIIKTVREIKESTAKAYAEEIEKAITTADGRLDGKISAINENLQSQLDEINENIDGLCERTDGLEEQVKGIQSDLKDILKDMKQLQDDVSSLLGRIQSVNAIPTYSDGSVGISSSSVISFEVFPHALAKEICELGTGILSLDAVYTQTKANVTMVNIPIVSESCDGGILSIEVQGNVLSNEFYSGEISASARLNISNKATDIASAFFPLTYEANGNTITEFSLSDGKNEYPAIGISKNTISVCLPYGIDITRMVAKFKTDGFKVDINGVPQKSGANANDFSKEVVYTVSPNKGDARNYTVDIHIFNLPTLYILTPNEVNIKNKTDWVAGTQIRLWHPDGSIEDLGGTSIKGRGNSTWANYPKKPYTLKLDSKASVLGMPKDKRWNLLANFADRTNLRNFVGLNLANLSQSIDWSPRGQHVELILNGKHNGLYYICEHIKVSKDRVNITEMKSTDTDGEKLTGGYLIEFDSSYDEVNKFKTAVRNLPCQFKSPDEEVLVPEQFNYLQDYVNNVEEMLSSENFTESGYQDYIDIDSFIDYLFVKEITFNKEMQIPRSIYMSKDRNGKLKMGPAWDFDLDQFSATSKTVRNKNSMWYCYLMKDPAFIERLKEKWNEEKDEFLKVVDLLDEIRPRIKDAADRDNEMWEINESHKYYTSDYQMNFDDATDALRDAIIKRINNLDEVFNSWE